MKLLRILSLLSTICAAWAASTLTLYEHEGQTGATKELTGVTPDFVDINFNDKVSSLAASGGDWELYGHKNYEGIRMVVKDGQKINTFVNDAYSSARPLCAYGADTNAKLTIYEHESSQGDSKEFNDEADYVGDEWNDKMSSVYAEKGDWELYSHEDYTGHREEVKEGASFDVSRNDHYSSLRPVCESYKTLQKCTVYKVELMSKNLNPTYQDTEIIGSVSSGSCYGHGTQLLALSNTDSVEESFSLETSESFEKNWYVEASVTVTASVEVFGVGTEFAVGITAGGGGSVTMGKAETKSFAEGSSKSVGSETTFELPGAALVFGLVDRYTIDQSDVSVKLHMTCSDGSKATKMTTMTLKSTKYPSAYYWSLTGKFNNAACRKNMLLSECVRNVARKYNHSNTKKQDIVNAFNLCFADGKGSVRVEGDCECRQ